MPAAVHPVETRLAAFKAGTLDATAVAEIETHLASCITCWQILESMPEDPVLARLKKLKGDDEFDSWGGDQGPTVIEAPRRPASYPDVPAGLRDHPRYRIVGLLGAGGMGTVYKAEHRLMERNVALKVVRSDLVSRPALVERFYREVKAAARLQHPNIVTAYDAESAGDVHFLVMEFIEGTDLRRRISEQGPMSLEAACRIIRQVAMGLQHAHEKGMVHRDLKPANILVQSEVPKIADFGLARFVSELRPSGVETEPGTTMGSPDYMAPEQINDPHRADIRADIYSLGCTLYHLLAGRPPFADQPFVQKLLAHAEKSAPPLGKVRTDLPAGFLGVLDRMLAKEPAARYQTPAEVAEALTVWTHQAPTKINQPASPLGPFRLAKVCAAAAGLLLLGVLAVVFANRRGSDGEQKSATKDGANPWKARWVAEPPPLLAWLKGREAVTVAQDGSGMYTTLQQAVAALRPGQVVRILDQGPYREMLEVTRLPADVGIVSDVGARVIIPQWNEQPTRTPIAGRKHYTGWMLQGIKGLRLAGLEITAAALPKNSWYGCMITLAGDGDIVIEACRVRCDAADERERKDQAPSLPVPVTFQVCPLAKRPSGIGHLLIQANDLSGALLMDRVPGWSVTLRRNRIAGWNWSAVQMPWQPGDIHITENVLRGLDGFRFPQRLPEYSADHKAARLVMTNNLFDVAQSAMILPSATTAVATPAPLTHQVRFQNNWIRSAQARGLEFHSIKDVEEANAGWLLGHNAYEQHPDGELTLPLRSTDWVESSVTLPPDPGDIRATRVPGVSSLASRGTGGDLPAYVGPLPPGPAPAQGDWYTRLAVRQAPP